MAPKKVAGGPAKPGVSPPKGGVKPGVQPNTGLKPGAPTAKPGVSPQKGVTKPGVQPNAGVKPGVNPNLPGAKPGVQPNAGLKPNVVPTQKPTVVPNQKPTVVPNQKPTVVPNQKPTVVPTQKPTVVPNQKPTVVPNQKPTVVPNKQPVSPNKGGNLPQNNLLPQNNVKPPAKPATGLKKMTPEEEKFLKENFAFLDANRNGFIERDEVDKFMGFIENPVERKKKVDKWLAADVNKDEKLSYEEFETLYRSDPLVQVALENRKKQMNKVEKNAIENYEKRALEQAMEQRQKQQQLLKMQQQQQSPKREQKNAKDMYKQYTNTQSPTKQNEDIPPELWEKIDAIVARRVEERLDQEMRLFTEDINMQIAQQKADNQAQIQQYLGRPLTAGSKYDLPPSYYNHQPYPAFAGPFNPYYADPYHHYKVPSGYRHSQLNHPIHSNRQKITIKPRDWK